MKQNLYKVLNQTPTIEVTKQDGTKLAKCTLMLQLPGSTYEDSLAVSLLGHQAQVTYRPSQLVWASLRFQARMVNDVLYNDIIASEIITFN